MTKRAAKYDTLGTKVKAGEDPRMIDQESLVDDQVLSDNVQEEEAANKRQLKFTPIAWSQVSKLDGIGNDLRDAIEGDFLLSTLGAELMIFLGLRLVHLAGYSIGNCLTFNGNGKVSELEFAKPNDEVSRSDPLVFVRRPLLLSIHCSHIHLRALQNSWQSSINSEISCSLSAIGVHPQT